MERGGPRPSGGQVQFVFFLDHLRLLAHMLFQRQSSKSIDVEIAAAEETLARAHKVEI